jgi:putative transcriptional regulator
VRRRLGFSQAEFAECIDVPIDTTRNWEQSKHCPTGAAKALLEVLDKALEAALAALP